MTDKVARMVARQAVDGVALGHVMSETNSEAALFRAFTRVAAPAFVPEIRLHLADSIVPLWQATERRCAAPQPPPFWAFAWPGSLALARYVLDTPHTVRGKRVLDFGSGGGLAAIAAARAGAEHVLASDLDPRAAAIQQLNAHENGVAFESQAVDLVGADVSVDTLLAGDVCYEREPAERTLAWLRRLAGLGVAVLVADPGRSYAPVAGLELLAAYDIPTLPDLESTTQKRTHLWRLQPI